MRQRCSVCELEHERALFSISSPLSKKAAAGVWKLALGEMQQQELGRDMQRNADWIRRGMGGYAVMSEAQIIEERLHKNRKRLSALEH